MNPDAIFDCLFLANGLQRDSGTFSVAELHLFAYLACLLSLYERQTVSGWGYSFVATELGAPFSLELANATDLLESSGHFNRTGDRLVTMEAVQQDLAMLAALELNQNRMSCLHAASSSVSAFSLGIIGSALAEEPELKRARDVPSTRQLLEDVAQMQLHEQFDALRSLLPQPNADLRVPAVVWLEALYRTQQMSLT